MSEAWFDELAEFLRIPSISADPLHASDVLKAAGWVCEFIRAAGGDCDIVDWHGQPLAIGELKASHGGPAPTVLCYGHFDVQPPDPLELWESEPFSPEIRGDYLYGRGTVDDKGQLYVLLAAARDLARAGELPVNVRFCCDGEEETGGHSIVEFLEADERGADAAVIFDSGMIRRDVPAFNVATRGVVYFHVTLRTGDRDLHSGVFGGAALNAAHALIATLGGLIAHDGTLADSLRQGVAPPTAAELADWAKLPAGAISPPSVAINACAAFSAAPPNTPEWRSRSPVRSVTWKYTTPRVATLNAGEVAPDHPTVEDDGCIRAALVGLEELDDRVAAGLLLPSTAETHVDRQLSRARQVARGGEQHVQLALVVDGARP